MSPALNNKAGEPRLASLIAFKSATAWSEEKESLSYTKAGWNPRGQTTGAHNAPPSAAVGIGIDAARQRTNAHCICARGWTGTALFAAVPVKDWQGS
jgi:hypothetical protein